jgi:hypothetical protein
MQELIKRVLIGLQEGKNTDRRELVMNENGAPDHKE